MTESQTLTDDRASSRLVLLIRAIGILFIIGGIWGIVSSLTNVPHFSIFMNLFGISIDVAGIVSVVTGCNLLFLSEDGRKWALWLTWGYLAVLVLAGIITVSQGNALDQFTLLQYHPENLFFAVSILILRLAFEIGLIAFLSSNDIKIFFKKQSVDNKNAT